MLNKFNLYCFILSLSAVGLTGCTQDLKFQSEKAVRLDAPFDDNVPPTPEPPPVVVEPPPAPEPPPVVVEPPPAPEPPPIVVTPPPPPPPIPDDEVPPLTSWASTCAAQPANGPLTGCMSCPGPAPGSDLSSKAKRLLDTMDRACRIPNKSEPEGYVPPTRAELIHRLRACNPQIYPDTVLTREERVVIPALATGDQALLQRMFGRLWYSPPMSDAFDHYFGLGIEEAVPLLCYKTKTALTGELWSREMWDWSMRDFVWGWPKELQELHAYYQHVRKGLVACLDQEGTGGPSGPIATPNPTVPPSCDIKGYSGVNVIELRARAAELLAAGYRVSLESGVACLMLTDSNFTLSNGPFNLVGMKCQ